MLMKSLVIDTNCLVQMISRHSPYRKIWDEFLNRRFQLCVSNEILDEYQEIIERQTSYRVAEKVVLLILNSRNVSFIDPHFRLALILEDPDDNKFVDCAFAANADFLVSNDRHFDILRKIPFPHLNIVTMDELLTTNYLE